MLKRKVESFRERASEGTVYLARWGKKVMFCNSPLSTLELSTQLRFLRPGCIYISPITPEPYVPTYLEQILRGKDLLRKIITLKLPTIALVALAGMVDGEAFVPLRSGTWIVQSGKLVQKVVVP